MKYSHAISIVVLSVLGMVGLGELGVMPYNFSIPAVMVVMVLAGFYWKSPDFLSGKNKPSFYGSSDLVVEPQEALEWLQNEYIPGQPGYKKLDLDKTSRNNMKLHTENTDIMINGESEPAFGVVGAPQNQHDKESIGYVVYCKSGRVDYNGERHTAESRLSPVERNKQWLVSKGFNAQVENREKDSREKGSVNIYQGGNPSNIEETGKE